MQKNNNHIEDSLLLSYIINELNDSDRSKVENWINRSDDNLNYFNRFNDVYNSNKYLHVFDKIDLEKNWNIVSGRISKTSFPKKGIIRNIYTKLAAASVILIFTIASYFYFKPFDSKFEHIIANNEMEVVLKDGSKVHLNKGAELIYLKDFEANKRLVQLKGEAFFDVEKDTVRPFVIDLNSSSVVVLGTQFNVDASSNTKVLVDVVEGCVRLFETINQSNFVDVSAGHQGVFDVASKNFVKRLIVNKNQIAWKTDTLVFSQTPLNEVFIDFKKYFDKEFHASNIDITDYKLSSKFTEPELVNVLNEICVLFDLDCDISQDTVYFYKN